MRVCALVKVIYAFMCSCVCVKVNKSRFIHPLLMFCVTFFCLFRGFFKFITNGKKEEEVRRKENQNNTYEILTLIPPTRSYSPFNIRGTNL